MELTNHTPYPAHLFRGVIDDRSLFASLAIRVTYDLSDGALRPSAEQPWPVTPGPWESEFGPMPSDDLFYRGGVDILVFGAARAPRGQTTTQLNVKVSLSSGWSTTVVVFGERRWQRTGSCLAPSAPAPFDAIPLTLAHAFGGSGEWDGLKVPFGDNPEGRGFYLDMESAEGNVLPNIEDPAALIRSWDDRPEPVGTQACAMGFGPRLRRSLVFNEQTNTLSELRPTFYNAAFPQLIAPAVNPGERIELTGVCAAGPLAFIVPPSELLVRLGFAEQRAECRPAIDQVGIDVERQRVFLSYRYPFRYYMTPLEKRWCELVLAAA